MMRPLPPASSTCVQTRFGLVHLIPDPSHLVHPRETGNFVRAYCHIHGSDHQTSLSIHRGTGWGRCFNGSCQARVLLEAWNPEVAQRLRTHMSISTRMSDAVFSPMTTEPPSPPRETISLVAWQQEERAVLTASLPHLQDVLATSGTYDVRRARAYLEQRGIPPALAVAQGVAYLPSYSLPSANRQVQRLLSRWRERVLFPLQGGGILGRSIWGWHVGQEEADHQAILARPSTPRRWLKTSRAEWWGPEPDAMGSVLVLVEGCFDRLALLAAGVPAHLVGALGGLTLSHLWLPAHVRQVILALDGDAAGHHAMETLTAQLTHPERTVLGCPAPMDDALGKDWNTRWYQVGYRGVAPVLDLLETAPLAVRVG